MRYFSNRKQAGQLLAEEIDRKLLGSHVAVVALNAGGVVVGAELAKKLHGSLYLLPVASVLARDQAGALDHMTSASAFSAILNTEHYNIEEITRSSEHMLNRLAVENFMKEGPIFSNDGIFNRSLLARHTIIIVSDGIANGLSVELADGFLRPIATDDIVVAAPICGADVLERVHDLTRNFYYLDTIQSDFPITHYFDEDDIPAPDKVIKMMSEISTHWK
jgi:putative phosphoribosyl transferase